MSVTEPRPNVLQRLLRWLRAGYPEGVPQQDYVALLGILRRRLTEDEVVQIAEQVRHDSGDGAGQEDIRAAIRHALLQQPDPADVARVADRLAMGSLSIVFEPEQTVADTRKGVVTRFTEWVREGYPAGVPAADHVALIALLRRRLTAEELIDIVVELRDRGVLPHDTGSIGAAILGTTQEMPSFDDIERVRTVLASHGHDFTAED